MNIKYKILTGVGGTNVVASASLLGATVIEVDREGVGVKESPFAAAWGTREYKFRPSFGQVIVNPAEPFAPGGESVYVLYKTY